MGLVRLRFEKGELVAEGASIPGGVYDRGTGAYRAPARRYREVVDYLNRWHIDYLDEALKAPGHLNISSDIALRDYQRDALQAWMASGGRGIIVLPTGSGKTEIAIKAIEMLGVSTLIIVPTLVLVEQWRKRLREAFGLGIGVVGGGRFMVNPLTVATYESASLRAEQLGDRFHMLVFDEVHHLSAPTFKRIGEMYLAPYRMGLTAKLGGVGGGLEALELAGDVVFEMGVEVLAGVHLSDYTIHTIYVPLSEREAREYEAQFSIYKDYIRKRGIGMRGPEDFQRFIRLSWFDPEARRALLARNRAMEIALNSEMKIRYLKRILEENPGEKVLIFTQHNSLVYRISREMLIPAITHQTSQREREEILERFRSGRYRRIVTSRILEEGVDVPDASVAIILSGTGSSREFIQRLGRILRKREGKHAKLYELVSRGTAEARLSRRRKA